MYRPTPRGSLLGRLSNATLTSSGPGATLDPAAAGCRLGSSGEVDPPPSRSGFGYVQHIEDYYEEFWERLPDELAPPDYELRRRFLLERARARDRALDLGCGAGAFTALLADAGADVGRRRRGRSGARPRPQGASRARLPARPDRRAAAVRGRAFDLVWASEVIEHVADTAAWLSEVRRVLVPQGRLLLTTPNHSRAAILLHGLERFSEPLGDHLHLYTRRSSEDHARRVRFRPCSGAAGAGPPLLRRMLLARAARG